MIAIVSGLPRSGTSLMMQMLHAGGAPVLSDNLRAADANNPKGYLEFERVKQLKTDKAWVPEAEDKVVKVISHLLQELPSGHEYRVIFMVRAPAEVVASQSSMLGRLGRTGASLPPEKIEAVYAQHVADIRAWLAAQPNFKVLYVQYTDVLANARAESARIVEFLGWPMNVDEMVKMVDPSLYRERKTSGAAKPQT